MPKYNLLHKESGMFLTAGLVAIDSLSPLIGTKNVPNYNWTINQNFDGIQQGRIFTHVEGSEYDINLYKEENKTINGIKYEGIACIRSSIIILKTTFRILELDGDYYISNRDGNFMTLVKEDDYWQAYLSPDYAKWDLIKE
ncbi:hypothetical protein [Ochrobactrum sp. Marseille-Q0166]|uniref:hypothetical protein n=1 Tax=Ochrobactrum sp. Marseille-Q0166 TaxID=2761105 RepID=UPI001655BD14|nr:hypothetical protein [Ochrobactrum sp. Marseille-Q0166]MBC8716819.1 hypothetical protein [Ochrobactrum sp. Marseille-Q0166]